MRIVVCVKQVPDTWAEKRLDPQTWTLERESVDGVMNELDEYAVEEALRIAEALGDGSTVTVLTMGPEKATETIRKALSMGVDDAIHLVDDGLRGSDAVSTSYAMAQALRTVPFDLVVLGSESTDARTSVIPAMLAEQLALPQLTMASKVELSGSNITIHRQTEDGYAVVEAALPAVVSVVEKINEPRYPSFKGIMAAKKKPLTTLTLADAGIEADKVGLGGAGTEVLDAVARPPRQAGTVVKDEGDGGVKIAEFLAASKFI